MLYASYKRLKDTTTIVSISHEINVFGFSLPRAHRWFLRQQVSRETNCLTGTGQLAQK